MPGLPLQAGEVVEPPAFVAVGKKAERSDHPAGFLVHGGDQLPPPFLETVDVVEQGVGHFRPALARAGNEKDRPHVHDGNEPLTFSIGGVIGFRATLRAMPRSTHLSSRERVRLALQHRTTDRIPVGMVCAGLNPPATQALDECSPRREGHERGGVPSARSWTSWR